MILIVAMSVLNDMFHSMWVFISTITSHRNFHLNTQQTNTYLATFNACTGKQQLANKSTTATNIFAAFLRALSCPIVVGLEWQLSPVRAVPCTINQSTQNLIKITATFCLTLLFGLYLAYFKIINGYSQTVNYM